MSTLKEISNSLLPGVALLEPTRWPDNKYRQSFTYLAVDEVFAAMLSSSPDQLMGKPMTGDFLSLPEQQVSQRLALVHQTGKTQQWRHDHGSTDQGLAITVSRLADQLLVSVQPLEGQQRVHQSIQRRLRLETMLSHLSGRLIHLRANQLDSLLDEVMGQISQQIGARQTNLFLYSADQQYKSCIHEWCAPGVISRRHINQHKPVNRFSWSYEQLLQGTTVCMDIDTLPPEASSEKVGLAALGIRSMILIPLIIQEKTLGFMGFYPITHLTQWAHDDLAFLETVTNLIASAWQRWQQEAQIASYTTQLQEQIVDRTRSIQHLSTLHQTVLEHVGQAIISTDLTGVIQTANKACERLCGYQSEALIGRVARMEPAPIANAPHHITYYIQDSAPPPSAAFLDAFVHQDSISQECVSIDQHGREVPVWITVSLIRDEAGAPVGYVSIATDMRAMKMAEIERHQRERQLLATSQRLQLATHAAGQGIWEIDWQQNRVIWDNQVFALHGLEPSPDAFDFEEFMALVHPDDRLALQTSYLTHTQGANTALSAVYRLIHPNGQVHYIESHGEIIYDTEGGVLRSLGVSWDVTERTLALLQLRERKQQFRQLAETVDDLHWIRSATEPSFSFINSSYQRLTGRTPESLYENPFSLLACIHPADRLRMQSVFNSIDTYEGTYQFRLVGARGEIHWMEAQTFLVRDEQDTLQYRTGVAKDITLQREREAFLQDALDREQALHQQKSAFITTASHEFRTPLTAISTSAELVNYYLQQGVDRPSTPPMIRHITQILGKVASLNELISDTLALSQLDEQKVTGYLIPTDLLSFSQSLIESTFSHLADQRQVVLEVVGTPVEVATDKKLLNHSLTNLLDNAVKFSKSNPVLRLLYDSSCVRLSIIDEGIGIPTADLPHLFTRFFRARNAGDFQGTGLGLAICREYIDLLHGQLEVESTEGKGSCFTITLPLG